MPTHDFLPGSPAPQTTGIAVVKSWGPPVDTLIVAAPKTGIIFIHDPKGLGMDTIIWELVSVEKNALHLKCGCGKAHCTREATYRRSVKGHHPQTR